MKFIRNLVRIVALLVILVGLLIGYLQFFTSVELLPQPQPTLEPGGPGVALVWTVEGASAPRQQTAEQPGRLALMDMDGTLSSVMELPTGTSTVIACGESAQSPDGRFFALYAGRDSGTLYLMEGMQSPQEIDAVERSACLGTGTFAFSPDGTRFAYIDYPQGAATGDFAAGTLKVVDAASTDTLYATEDVTAFDISNDTVAYVRFFTDDEGAADEAVVQVWDGSSSSELASLTPDDNSQTGTCDFVSASVKVLPGDSLSLVIGQQCPRTGQSSWQLYEVNAADGATLRGEDDIVGNFQTFGRTNVQFAAPGASEFAFTAPDGVVANTAGLFAVERGDFSTRQIVDRQIVMPANTTPANATPRLSPDGRWLAFVQTSPNFENTLVIYNLADLSQRPTEFSAGSPGDTISALAFAQDSRRLLAVAGGDETANNALVMFTLSSGDNSVVARGRFHNDLAVSSNMATMGDWQFLEDDTEPPYLNLVAVNTNDGSVMTLFEGATVEDGEVVEQRFASPLAFRR